MQAGTFCGRLELRLLVVLLLTPWGCEGQKDAEPKTAEPTKPAGKTVIAMLPKLINIDYFDTCKRGATKTAEELGVTLLFNGPTEATAEGQNQFIETWIRQKVQAICIAPNQPKSV